VRIIAVVADVGMQAASLWAGGFVPLFLAMLLHIILGGVSGQLIRAVCRVRQNGYPHACALNYLACLACVRAAPQGIFLVWFARRGWSFHRTGAKKAEAKDVLNPIVKERRGSVGVCRLLCHCATAHVFLSPSVPSTL
jgi:hypothetical protein